MTLKGAQAQIDPGSNRYGSYSSGVSWTVDVSPVVVTPGGATQDSSGTWNILVGQGCTDGLGGIPDALRNNATNPPTYLWSVGGTTFQDWEPTMPAFPNANPPTQANSQASYYNPGPGVVTNPLYSWYWNDNLGSGKSKPETVTCTVTVTPPAGQGSAFPVTATQNGTVYVPQ